MEIVDALGGDGLLRFWGKSKFYEALLSLRSCWQDTRTVHTLVKLWRRCSQTASKEWFLMLCSTHMSTEMAGKLLQILRMAGTNPQS